MSANSDIIGPVLISTILLVFMASGMIIFILVYQHKSLIQKNKLQAIEAEKQIELMKVAINTEEKERKRIAKNIHDGLGPYLTGLRGIISVYKEELKNNSRMLKYINEGNEIIDIASASISEICSDLTPTLLMKFTFFEAIEVFTKSLSVRRMKVNYEITHGGPIPEMQEADAINLFRVYQEVMNNILKYSDASELNIDCFTELESVSISFIHDGKHFTNDDANEKMKGSKGIGLKSIYSRISVLNGTIDYLTSGNISRVDINVNIK